MSLKHCPSAPIWTPLGWLYCEIIDGKMKTIPRFVDLEDGDTLPPFYLTKAEALKVVRHLVKYFDLPVQMELPT